MTERLPESKAASLDKELEILKGWSLDELSDSLGPEFPCLQRVELVIGEKKVSKRLGLIVGAHGQETGSIGVRKVVETIIRELDENEGSTVILLEAADATQEKAQLLEERLAQAGKKGETLYYSWCQALLEYEGQEIDRAVIEERLMPAYPHYCNDWFTPVLFILLEQALQKQPALRDRIRWRVESSTDTAENLEDRTKMALRQRSILAEKVKETKKADGDLIERLKKTRVVDVSDPQEGEIPFIEAYKRSMRAFIERCQEGEKSVAQIIREELGRTTTDCIFCFQGTLHGDGIANILNTERVFVQAIYRTQLELENDSFNRLVVKILKNPDDFSRMSDDEWWQYIEQENWE